MYICIYIRIHIHIILFVQTVNLVTAEDFLVIILNDQKKRAIHYNPSPHPYARPHPSLTTTEPLHILYTAAGGPFEYLPRRLQHAGMPFPLVAPRRPSRRSSSFVAYLMHDVSSIRFFPSYFFYLSIYIFIYIYGVNNLAP